MSKTSTSTNEKTVKVEVELPEKWINMINAIEEWEGRGAGLQGFIRASVKASLRADIESMDCRPVSDEA